MGYLGTKPANQVIDSTLIADGTVTPSDLSTGAPYWNTNGTVGLGVTSPTSIVKQDIQIAGSTSNAALQVRSYDAGTVDGSTTSKIVRAVNSGGGNWANAQYDAWAHIWTNAGTERMRIDSSGRVTKPYQPAFDVRINSNWNTNSSYITSWVATTNTGNHFNTGTGTFTAPVSGWYAFSYTAGGSGYIAQDIHVNGTGRRRLEWSANAAWLWATMSCAIYLNANDAVRLWHQSGQVYASSTENGFSGYLLG